MMASGQRIAVMGVGSSCRAETGWELLAYEMGLYWKQLVDQNSEHLIYSHSPLLECATI